jgi:hypothetical protein
MRNYVVVYRPIQQVNALEYSSLGPLAPVTRTPWRISFKAAKYDAATETVTLISKDQLGTAGSYRISSPPSLGATHAQAKTAHPLIDQEGNALQSDGTHVPGYFSFTISRGHPYVAAQPRFSAGN